MPLRFSVFAIVTSISCYREVGLVGGEGRVESEPSFDAPNAGIAECREVIMGIYSKKYRHDFSFPGVSGAITLR